MGQVLRLAVLASGALVLASFLRRSAPPDGETRGSGEGEGARPNLATLDRTTPHLPVVPSGWRGRTGTSAAGILVGGTTAATALGLLAYGTPAAGAVVPPGFAVHLSPVFPFRPYGSTVATVLAAASSLVGRPALELFWPLEAALLCAATAAQHAYFRTVVGLRGWWLAAATLIGALGPLALWLAASGAADVLILLVLLPALAATLAARGSTRPRRAAGVVLLGSAAVLSGAIPGIQHPLVRSVGTSAALAATGGGSSAPAFPDVEQPLALLAEALLPRPLWAGLALLLGMALLALGAGMGARRGWRGRRGAVAHREAADRQDGHGERKSQCQAA
jgi:hypothetical protein